MKKRILCASQLAGLIGATGLIGPAVSPAHAYNVYLDYNTDGILQTFNGQVDGPVTAPIDVVMEFGPSEVGITYVEARINWGYGGPGGMVGCYDVFGSINYIPYQPLPDTGPFTNIVPFTCVCREHARCFCDSQLTISTNVSIAAPGLYRLTTLDFSRQGFARDCTSPIYPEAIFTTGVPGPGSTVVFRDPAAVGAEEGVEARAWGRIKATYR